MKNKLYFGLILIVVAVINSVGDYLILKTDKGKKCPICEECPKPTQVEKKPAYGNKYKLGYLGGLENISNVDERLDLSGNDHKNHPMIGGNYFVTVIVEKLGEYSKFIDNLTGENLLKRKVGEKIRPYKEVWLKLSEKSVAGVTQMIFRETEPPEDFEGDWAPSYISIWIRGNEIYEMQFMVMEIEELKKYKSEFEKIANSFEFVF